MADFYATTDADYCGSCGQYQGGPILCCHQSSDFPPVGKENAKRLRALVAERDALLAWCEKAYHAWNGTGPAIVLDELKAAINAARGKDEQA